MRSDMSEPLHVCINRCMGITITESNVAEMLSVAATNNAIFYFHCNEDKWRLFHIQHDFAVLFTVLNNLPTYGTWTRWAQSAATGYTMAMWRDKEFVQALYVGVSEKYKDVQHFLTRDGFSEIIW